MIIKEKISVMISVDRWLSSYESSKELSLISGRLKAAYRLSFADAWIAATAIFYDATLVHKDPEFEQLQDKFKVLKLPYKEKG